MTNEIQFTGERVVPNRTCHPQTFAEHLIRYSFAMRYAKVENALDLACGTGYGSKIIGWLAQNSLGADVSDEAIKTAEELNERPFYKIDFEKEKLTNAFKQNFDLITSFETIEHLDDPHLFLQGIKDILKDGGKFIYSIPLSNPSKYHKVVYNFESAYKLIEQYFEHEEIFIQEGIELVNFNRMKGNIDGLNKRGIFLIGVCHKKNEN